MHTCEQDNSGTRFDDLVWFVVQTRMARDYFASVGRLDLAKEYDQPGDDYILRGFFLGLAPDGWFRVTPWDMPYHEVEVSMVFDSEAEVDRYLGIGR